MSSFLDKFIADTYNGILHSDVALTETGLSEIFDGDGNKSSLLLGRDTQGAKINGPFTSTTSIVEQDLTVGGDITADDITADDITADDINANTVNTGSLVIRNSLQAANVTYPVSNNEISIFALIYPVGSIYLSMIDIDPGSMFVGTIWSKVSEGRFLVGIGTGNDGTTSKTFGVGITGGEYDHRLSVSEMPSHGHSVATGTGGDNTDPFFEKQGGIAGANNGTDIYSLLNEALVPHIKQTGDDNPHNNTPPGFGVYVWQRTV